jgi:hypothetical protein
MPQLMPLLVTPKTEGLQVFCEEDQQMLLLPLIFYAISQKTISINLSGYWILCSRYKFRGFLHNKAW